MWERIHERRKRICLRKARRRSKLVRILHIITEDWRPTPRAIVEFLFAVDEDEPRDGDYYLNRRRGVISRLVW